MVFATSEQPFGGRRRGQVSWSYSPVWLERTANNRKLRGSSLRGTIVTHERKDSLPHRREELLRMLAESNSTGACRQRDIPDFGGASLSGGSPWVADPPLIYSSLDPQLNLALAWL